AINSELEKIIAYVSRHGGGLQLEALELELYRQGQIEILVPKRHGQLSQPQETQLTKKILTFDEVLKNCPDDHSRELLALLRSLWESNGHYVKPGTVGASFQAQIGSRPQPIFWAYPDYLQNAFSDIMKREAPSGEFERYRQSVAKIPGFNGNDILAKSQPI